MKHTEFKANLLSIAIRHSLLAITVLGSSISSVSVFANTTIIQKIQISAGSLAHVVNQFAEQTGILLTYDSKLLESKQSTGLKGSYNLESGFIALLSQHNLQLQKTAAGYTIISKPQSQQQIADVGQLKKIDVTAIHNVAQLPAITVNAEKDDIAKDHYLVKKITGVGLWGERDLRDTPYSMTVIPQDLIQNVNAKDMNQLFKMNPMTQETATKSAPASDSILPVIRGFNPRILVNGIPHSIAYRASPMMQNIERVEIINGATGFLYGGGKVGGAVNYITKKPTIDNLRTLSIGTYGGDSYFSHLDLSGQFDKEHIFGYRVNAIYQDGELASHTTTKQKAISLVLDWKPTDNFYTDLKYSNKALLENAANSIFNEVINRQNIKNQSYSPDWIENEVKSNALENSTRWNISEKLTLRTALSYENTRTRGDSVDIILKNQTALQIPEGTYWRGTTFSKNAWQKTTTYGGNIFLDYKFNTFDINHNLTFGYSTEQSKYYRHPDNWDSYSITHDMPLNEIQHFTQPPALLWEESGMIGMEPLKARQKLEFKNILLGDDINFNDQWSALVGFNYASIMSLFYPSNYKYDKSELTPTLSLIYKPIENLTTYATYIENLEQGDQVPNSPEYNNPGQLLEPYKSKQYEIGTKYSFNDDFLITSAVFRIEKANLAKELDGNGKFNYTNDGLQIHQGLEFGLIGKITNDLTLVSGLTFMQLDIDKSDNKSLEGKKPTDAASKMVKIYAEYNIPAISGLSISGGAYYTGKKYANDINTDILPAYTLFDAGLRYKTQAMSYPTTFNLNVQNLSNKNYWGSNTNVGDPRTVTFAIKTQF